MKRDINEGRSDKQIRTGDELGTDEESGADEGTSIIDDGNQYKDFDLDDDPESEKSFPVLEKSKESRAFRNDFAKILHYLRTHEIEWRSVECVGRRSERKKIRTTVLIGLSKVPDIARQEEIKKGLESEITSPPLPIEFAEGGFIEESNFGFK